MDLLRFSTAGNVDDGKSTLIGRLLYDTKSVFEDQLDSLLATSRTQGHAGLNLALLTDGLRSEREQGITIDVAYRYFATEKRKFIIADTPGHFEFTRNMVTGASNSDVSLVLIDASRGISSQTKRHALVSEFLGIPHVIFCVNKMDLVGNEENKFLALRDEVIRALGTHLRGRVTFVPISALTGDNVTKPTTAMPWYAGPSLLEALETVPIERDSDRASARFPVQLSIGVGQEILAAGTLVSGTLRPGDEVRVLPAGKTDRIAFIRDFERELPEARAGQAVQLGLESGETAPRGTLISAGTAPRLESSIRARICWLGETPLRPPARLIARFRTVETGCEVRKIEHEIDVETLGRIEGHGSVSANGLAEVLVRLDSPVAHDPYARNRATGAFVLIDPATYSTIAAAMVI